MSKTKYDFSGYATRANVKCTDGRIILKDAFKDNDGTTVPVVWQHMHSDPSNVLGHAVLENREDGVYSYVKLNDTEAGKNAKLLVSHGDITSLSIYANQLVEKTPNVVHGVIREVSLVLAGANPGALIDNVVVSHSDGSITNVDDEAIIYSGEAFVLKKSNDVVHEDGESGKTVGEVFETLSEEQKTAVYAIMGSLIDEDEEIEQSDTSNGETISHKEENQGETVIMKTNVFEGSAVTVNDKPKAALTHDQIRNIFADAQRRGSLREAFLAHAGTYGIDNIDYLFPDAQAVTSEPTFISRDMEWVSSVVPAARHTPFSRIKSVHADITVESARALGYITGALKKEEVFALLRRITTPTTIYKKQKLDRDDIIDITDLDVVAWLKREMRVMLDEEIARAALLGDGRDPITEAADKIDETCIRPIWKDANLYAHHHFLASTVTDPQVMDEAIKARIQYKGSGNPVMFVGPTLLTDWLLLKDLDGRRLYPTVNELAAAMRVSKIVEVPLMDSLERDIDPLFPDGGGTPVAHDLLCIIVNMRDYTMGADKGGQISFFDDFDIDYNQYKYLLEGRMSGALTLPKSALVIERAQ